MSVSDKSDMGNCTSPRERSSSISELMMKLSISSPSSPTKGPTIALDPRMIGEIGGELLFTKITRPHTARMVIFSPGLFKIIPKGSLLVRDNNLLEQLQLTVTRSVEDGSFHRCGVVLIVDKETLNTEELLRSLNMRMRSLWASTTVLIKPWNGGLPRGRDGHFLTAAVGDIHSCEH